EVVIIDRTGPTFPVFEDIGVSVPEGQTSMSVSWDDTAVDPHGVAWSECVPASGSTFSLGLHRVTCSAEDLAGNRTTERFVAPLSRRLHSEHGTASPSAVCLAQRTTVIDGTAVTVVLTHGRLGAVGGGLVGSEDRAVMLLSDGGCGVSVEGLGLRFEQDAPS